MHFKCEIIMPPTDDIEAAVATVLEPFSETGEESRHAFYDWYVIGGRFAGSKMQASIAPNKLKQFYDWLKAEGCTVSGVQVGKHELQPRSQIPKVDSKWSEMFPEHAGPCPLFAHSSDQYAKSGTLPGDICTVEQIPEGLTAVRVIICKPGFQPEADSWTGPVEAAFMLADDVWNGCNFMEVAWDRKVTTALEKYKEKLADYTPAARKALMPRPDWICVTVDCHN